MKEEPKDPTSLSKFNTQEGAWGGNVVMRPAAMERGGPCPSSDALPIVPRPLEIALGSGRPRGTSGAA